MKNKMAELIKNYVAATTDLDKDIARDTIEKHAEVLLARLASGDSTTLQGYSDTDVCVEAITALLWNKLND
jgi:nucleoid DNA-binding protein